MILTRPPLLFMPTPTPLRAIAAFLLPVVFINAVASADAANTEVVISPSPDWRPLDVFTTAIAPGGVFDFSVLNDAPAGKYGPITVTAEGHFEFKDRPGVRARFWGINLVSSACFLEPEKADRLVDQLARSGYNTVRLHHFDRALQVAGAASGTLDPVKLDQLDYLFAACKKRGLYLNIDLYSLRLFNSAELQSFGLPADAAEGLSGGEAATLFRATLPFSDPAFAAWAAYARALLQHRNPYTRLTWADDPALIGICPVNEDTAGPTVERNPLLAALYEREFAAWLERDDHREILARDGHDGAFGRFLIDAHLRIDQRLLGYLRDLGVRTPLTGSNHRNSQGMVYLREAYDYVDNHQYWDHPRFPGKRFQFPYKFTQESAVAATARTPRNSMPARILGKPYTITEFNYLRPNRHRSEGGVLMPAYASLQDWDALYNFDYANGLSGDLRGNLSDNFSLASDPIGLLADRLSAVLFLRGDIAPAPGSLVFATDPRTAFVKRETYIPQTFAELGLVTRISSRSTDPVVLGRQPGVSAVVIDQDTPPPANARLLYLGDDHLHAKLIADGILPAGSIDDDAQRFRSETGQIDLNATAGTFQVSAPRAELFVLPARANLTGTVVSVANKDTFCSVSVVSADGAPLAESRRLLVLHLADALPTGTRFSDDRQQLLVDRGDWPFLIRRAVTDITLRLPTDATCQAWAVGLDGTRLQPVPIEKTDAGWVLHARTDGPDAPHLAYEILRR
jgi:hypothetical protein